MQLISTAINLILLLNALPSIQSTTLIAHTFNNGVILGNDSRTSIGSLYVVNRNANKVEVFGNYCEEADDDFEEGGTYYARGRIYRYIMSLIPKWQGLTVQDRNFKINGRFLCDDGRYRLELSLMGLRKL